MKLVDSERISNCYDLGPNLSIHIMTSSDNMIICCVIFISNMINIYCAPYLVFLEIRYVSFISNMINRYCAPYLVFLEIFMIYWIFIHYMAECLFFEIHDDIISIMIIE